MNDKELKQVNYNFNVLKDILNDKFMIKEEVNGFFYPSEAVELVKFANVKYFINSYYNLSVSDILNLTEDADTLTDVKKSLFYDYKTEYAAAWYDNYINVLKNIKPPKRYKKITFTSI